MKVSFSLFTIVFALLYGTACDSSSRKPPPPPVKSKVPIESPKETYPIIVKDTTAYVELAYTEVDRKKGLMNREGLPPDTGMLFIFPKEKILSFWMKNVVISLSTAFFNKDGYIVKIVDMAPEGNVPDWALESYSSDIPATYVLEMEYGWFESHGIKEGDRISLPDSILSIVPEQEY